MPVKNLIALILLPLLFFITNCKKSDSTTTAKPTPTPTPTTSPYYFKFSFHDSSFNFTGNFPQYMTFYANEAGGYEVAGDLYPSAGLRLSWPADDTVKESDLMGLVGKTIHFNDTLPHPEVSYSATASSTEWLSADTSNASYNVKITNVVYLKKDTTLGVPVKTYVITGTCSAVMTDYTLFSVFSGGSFSFVISMQDH